MAGPAPWTAPGAERLTERVDVERIVPILTVPDLAEAVRQHTEVLGLEVVMDNGWVAFLSDGSGTGRQLGLMTTDASAPVNPDVSVFVDDVRAAYASARAADVEIVHPLTVEEWGVTRFFYRDAAGRVINVGQHT